MRYGKNLSHAVCKWSKVKKSEMWNFDHVWRQKGRLWDYFFLGKEMDEDLDEFEPFGC